MSSHASNSLGCDSQLLIMVDIKDSQRMADCISKHLSFLLLSNVVHTNITMGDYETKEEKEFEETKTDTEEALEDAGEGLEDAGDKVKAGAKAFGKKIADPDKDLESEYQKEKIEEKTD